jgi:tetratricopeptide (TPR) repeat protein
MTDIPLPQHAVHAALAQNWKEAIRVNTAILKINKEDIEALLRLAYACLKTGQMTSAKKTYEKVLLLDQYNQIAHKNLKKLSLIKKKNLTHDVTHHLSPMMFLEEPGKTKIVECIHLAPTQTLSTLSAGQEVYLKPRNHCVEIRSAQNTYLAALPDDVSFKINKLLTSGNTYLIVVKNVEKNTLKVFIRELSRGKKFAHQPSFTASTSYIPFAKGGSAPEGPDMTPTGEDADREAPDETPET